MNNRKNRNPKALYAALGLALLLAGGASALGMWVSLLFPTFHAFPLLGILAIAFMAACVVNRIAAKTFARRHFGMSAEERHDMIEAYETECKRDPEAVLKRFSDMEAVPVFMLGLYFLLTLALATVGGMCATADGGWLHAAASIGGMTAGFYFLFMPLLRICEQIPPRLNKDALIPTSELPILHEMARKAAKTAGVKGTVRIEITCDCECDANRIGNTCVVFLGTRLLAVLTKEELEQALLLSFAVLSRPNLNRQVFRRYRLGMLGDADVRAETFAFDLFFSYADAYLEWSYELYVMAFKRYLKRLAYACIHQSGDAERTVSFLAKRAFWRYFVFEFIRFVPKPFHAEPTPPTHYEQDICAGFWTACRTRHTAWLSMMERQIPVEGDRDYCFRDERTMVDPDGRIPVRIEDFSADSPYGQEVLSVIRDIADGRLHHADAEQYARAREREYLEPLRTVEAYEAAPDGYSTHELSPVINAYRDTGRFDKAEAICDDILARETNPFAMAHAMYFKGMCQIHRYESEGIDLIYRAIDLNKNYMKDGFEMVEDYCALAGLADEYAACIRRADLQTKAHGANQESAAYLAATDHLVREEELGGMLPDILSYMEGVADGCLREIYLVRKVVSEDFFTSVFVINFDYGVPDAQMREVYSAIFNYLDAYPVDWQFSLFVYDRETERAVKRIEGSLVWAKKE